MNYWNVGCVYVFLNFIFFYIPFLVCILSYNTLLLKLIFTFRERYISTGVIFVSFYFVLSDSGPPPKNDIIPRMGKVISFNVLVKSSLL